MQAAPEAVVTNQEPTQDIYSTCSQSRSRITPDNSHDETNDPIYQRQPKQTLQLELISPLLACDIPCIDHNDQYPARRTQKDKESESEPAVMRA